MVQNIVHQCGKHTKIQIAKMLKVPVHTLIFKLKEVKIESKEQDKSTPCYFCHRDNRKLTNESLQFAINQCGSHALREMANLLKISKTCLNTRLKKAGVTQPLEKKNQDFCYFCKK